MSSVDILVTNLLKLVADSSVATCHKKQAYSVQRDEVLVEIESDKVVLEVSAPEVGVLETLLEDAGATVTARQVLGRLRPSDITSHAEDRESPKPGGPHPGQAPYKRLGRGSNDAMSPAIRRFIAEHDVNLAAIQGSGIGGCLTREDVKKHIAERQSAVPAPSAAQAETEVPALPNRSETRVQMTRLRKRMAERMLEETIALLC